MKRAVVTLAFLLIGPNVLCCAAQSKDTPSDKGNSLDQLIQILQTSKDATRRREAVDRLAKLHRAAKEAAPPLIERFDDSNVLVAQQAELAVIGFGVPAIPFLIDGLKSKAYRVRASCMTALMAIRSASKGAADKEIMAALAGLTKDIHPLVRGRAISSLGEFGPAARDTTPLLRESLAREKGGFRVQVAMALAKIDPADDALAPALNELLDSKSDGVRAVAATVLGQLHPKSPGLMPALCRGLSDGAMTVRKSATKSLKKIGPPVIPEMVKILSQDADTLRRMGAAYGLGRFGPTAKDAAIPLINALTDKELLVRSYAVESLGEIGPVRKEVVPAMIECVKDRKRGIQSIAALAIGRIGPPAKDAVPALLEMLENRSEIDRKSAIQALGQIGPDAKEAIPIIEKLAKNDPDPSVRAAAASALKTMWKR